MQKKAASGIVLTLLLSMSMLASSGVMAQSVIAIGIGVYWDFSLMNRVSSINWGILQPGSVEDVVVYIRNEGDLPISLSMASSNWNPLAASSYMTLNWNYTGGVLEPSSVVPVKLSLFVISSIVGICAFSFDFVLSATGSLTVSVLIATCGSITRTWIVDDDGPADFPTIQEAINAANLGDTIFVYNGTYYESISISKDNLTLLGENKNGAVIDGSRLASGSKLLEVNADYIKLDGFTIQNGRYPYGGIRVVFSSETTISNNIIAYNSWPGIDFYYSHHNTISNNIISNNQVGVYFTDSNNNAIYHNNFIKNGIHQAYSYGSTNSWDDSYPSGGNYWSDYTIRYPSAQELDDSGLWDTPYVIDANNRDRYSLMNPWTPTPPIIVANIDIDPDTLNLESKGKWITAYIQLPDGYNAVDINASTILLNGTIAPVLDPKYGFVTNSSEYLVDHNNDGILERMVKFNRTEVEPFINSQGIGLGKVPLTVTGRLFDGTSFEGTDIIFVVYGGGGGRRK